MYYDRKGKSDEVVFLYATVTGLLGFMAGVGLTISMF